VHSVAHTAAGLSLDQWLAIGSMAVAVLGAVGTIFGFLQWRQNAAIRRDALMSEEARRKVDEEAAAYQRKMAKEMAALRSDNREQHKARQCVEQDRDRLAAFLRQREGKAGVYRQLHLLAIYRMDLREFTRKEHDRLAAEDAGYVIDFEAFCAARRPEPRPDGTGLLIAADGSAFPVLPGALRPATARAARARAAAAGGWPDDPGELRKSRKRSAELAGVADIPPAPRTAGEIIGALFGTHRPASSGT